MMELNKVPSGARVIRPNAIPFDFAFHRTGTVIREKMGGHTRLGIQWDGSGSIFAYPEDTEVQVITEEGKK